MRRQQSPFPETASYGGTSWRGPTLAERLRFGDVVAYNEPRLNAPRTACWLERAFDCPVKGSLADLPPLFQCGLVAPPRRATFRAFL